MRTLLLVPITVAVVANAGCFRSRCNIHPVDQPRTNATVANQGPDCTWEAIQETLRRRGFRLDRVDRESGVVTTMPETSQHFFEIWRRDVNTRADFWEASLSPVRRWIEVQLASTGDGADEVSVIVHKERLSSLDRQFNSTGAAYQYFGENLPSTTGKAKVTIDDDRWIDRGRDSAMEQYYLAEILERASLFPG